MTKIFVISMSSGEYSDRTEWIVRAYRTEDEAKAFLKKFETEYKTRWAQCNFPNANYYEARNTLFKKGWFPDIPTLDYPDYTGFYIWYDEVDLID